MLVPQAQEIVDKAFSVMIKQLEDLTVLLKNTKVRLDNHEKVSIQDLNIVIHNTALILTNFISSSLCYVRR